MFGFCRKLKIRRRNLARRQWKKNPLFAFEIVLEKWGKVYRQYTYEDFLKDVKVKSKREKKRKKTKYNLREYLSERHLSAYLETGSNTHAIWASRHVRNRNKPFEIVVLAGDGSDRDSIISCYLDVRTPFDIYKKFMCDKPKTQDEFDKRYKEAYPYGRSCF